MTVKQATTVFLPFSHLNGLAFIKYHNLPKKSKHTVYKNAILT